MTKGKAPRVKTEAAMPAIPTWNHESPQSSSATNTYAARSVYAPNPPPSSSWAPSVYQNYRSDAPAPSERRALTVDDTEPVLLELRSRGANMAAENSMQSNDGLFDGSFRDFGDRVKALNDTLAELQQLGVSHILSLPELVLVGDQSAGKSSLMSGMAGINLPRSEGVCTRCPIHIRVSRNQEWSCRVSLQQDYAFNPPTGREITKADVTSRTPFPPWVKQQREVKDFKTIYNKSEIEDILRWAQVAILNHNQNHELFIPGSGAIARQGDLASEAESTAAKFSPNTVALEIRGPDLPDLSFYDLPGIFRNSAREEDEYLVQVVENLAREYISHSGALIIWAVPMNADPETSSTLSIIRNLGATQRTIGVMTKADLLPIDSNHGQWSAMLRGESHKIGHEYFITSRPTDQGLEDQAHWEECLFSEEGHSQWPAGFREFRERSGVERLKASLSEKLGKEFAKSLPSIKQKVIHRLNHVQNELRNLPELPNNVELEIRKSLMLFSAMVKEKLRGKEFSSDYGKLSEAFRDCILHIKPKFTLKDPSDAPVLDLIESDTEENQSNTPSNRKRGLNAQTPSAKRFRPTVSGASFSSANGVKAEDGNSPTPQTPNRPPRLPPPALLEPFARYRTIGQKFRTLRQISEDIRAMTKAGMPNLVPDEVYEDLCKQAVQPWHDPTTTFLQETMNLLHRIVNAALEQAFGTLKRRLIFKESKSHMQGFLEQCRSMTSAFLNELYQMETFQLFTVNRGAFDYYEKTELRLLTRYRHVMRWEAFTWDKTEFPDWEKMTPQQRLEEEKRHASETAKMGPDVFDKELKVAAYVRGYYKLAALRYADTVSLSITSRMFPNIVSKLDCYLDEKLGLMGAQGPAMYQRLMDEDDATARKRERLKGEMNKFAKAMESIHDLEQQSGAVAVDGAASQQGGSSESFDESMDIEV